VAVVAGLVISLLLGWPASGLGAVTGPDPRFPASLKAVSVPKPANLGDFVRDEAAAIRLGKALFWDMQVGSDGLQACASCHFNAGADSRSKNQLSPGLIATPPDTTIAKGANYQLTKRDFPLGMVAGDNDVVSSQGVFHAIFVGVVPGQVEDVVEVAPDQDGFQVGGINVRRVEPRNTPTVINAVFNHRNFWDGRAQDVFNGVNPFGERDPDAKVYRAPTGNDLVETAVRLENSSLASQAVGPPLSGLEMSADGRTHPEIGAKLGRGVRQKGRKLLPLRPLARQLVHPQDGVLGALSRAPQNGLAVATYEEMIKAAFRPEWWRSNKIIRVARADGARTIVAARTGDPADDEYSLIEYNFSLFFGLAVQVYEATLVSDDAPFDRFQEGTGTLTTEELAGAALFFLAGNDGGVNCTRCHRGSETTEAAVREIATRGLTRRTGGVATGDTGFRAYGVRPETDDVSLGGLDPFGNPLSIARLENPAANVDGGFKIPTVRNAELTAPFMHHGGLGTLEQLVDFYRLGSTFPAEDAVGPLALLNDPTKAAQLVAFLKAMTDDRVRHRKAPFDHPQLFIPNGHPGSPTMSVDSDGDGNADDDLIEIPAVGANGGDPLPTFADGLPD
jgi:cytochrome c peroxidase